MSDRQGPGIFLLILLGGAILLGLIAGGNPGLAPLRAVLGLGYALVVPGFCLAAAIFPRQRELDLPERLAVSVGLSVAIIPVLALILDQLPGGIRLIPIIIALGWVILLSVAVGWFRRVRLAPAERFRVIEGIDLGRWGRGERLGAGILLLALVIVLASLGAITFLPRPAERLTEFYLLGAKGAAEDYPREARVGQATAITLGISNQEAASAEYRVTVMQDGQPIGQAETVQLGSGDTRERSIHFTPVAAGEEVKIDFLLYRDGIPIPYRSLALWLTVQP